VVNRATVAQSAGEHIAEMAAQIPYFPDRDVRLVAGNQPGLYGATTPQGPCDAAAAATFLQGHPDQDRAWAQAIGSSRAPSPIT
jgi:hypothetical protein